MHLRIGLLAIATTAMHASAQLVPGDHRFVVHHGGRERFYSVHVPAHSGSRPLPVMLALHGGGGSGEQFKQDNGLDVVADAHAFVAVYPDGTGPIRGRLLTWNAATNCCGPALRENVDDVGFLDRVLDDLRLRLAVDTNRVYVMGHSNGAMMAYKYAAMRSDRVAALIAVGGALDWPVTALARPVPLLHIHSVDDPRALYEGGMGPPFPGTQNRVEHAPVMRGLQRWATLNGCTAKTRVTETRKERRQSASLIVFEGCPPNAPVEHWRLTGVGHGWPGSQARPVMQRIIGPPTTLLSASAVAWQFSERFSH